MLSRRRNVVSLFIALVVLTTLVACGATATPTATAVPTKAPTAQATAVPATKAPPTATKVPPTATVVPPTATPQGPTVGGTMVIVRSTEPERVRQLLEEYSAEFARLLPATMPAPEGPASA